MAASLNELLLNDRGFVFDPASGETFQLSATALHIVRMLQQSMDEEEITTKILEEYEIDEHTARRDLHSFLESIKAIGWK